MNGNMQQPEGQQNQQPVEQLPIQQPVEQLPIQQLPIYQPQPQQEPPVKKKSKKGLLVLFLILIIGAVGGYLYLQNNNKKTEPKNSNSNIEDSNNNGENQIKSDKISLIAEDVNVVNSYSGYFETEEDGSYFVIDQDGKKILENPLYLTYAITDGKAIYKGKSLAVSGTFDKYKIYYSTDNPELGYVAVFDAYLNLESNDVKNYYLGNDIVISIYWNQQTEENFIVKYNIKTGAVLTEKIIDGSLDLISWNGKKYLAETHTNIIDIETLNKVFKKDYVLGDGPYRTEQMTLISASNRYLTAALDGKYGIIDASENVIIPFQYTSLQQVNDKVIIARTKDGYGLIDYKNQKILDFVYDQIDVYDNCIVTIDHNGILRVLNNQYETLFTGSRKILTSAQDGVYSFENIREKRNIFAYYQMVSGLEDSSYFALVDVGSGKAKELVEYSEYKKVNRSPKGYGYIVFMSDENFSVYDGISEISKVNVSEYSFTSAENFYYVGNDYITFQAKVEGEEEAKQYFLNMKKNILEELNNTNLKQEEVLTYDELFDNGYFLNYENDRITIYDENNTVLASIVGNSINPLVGLKNYYEITNGKKVTIIRINEK